MFLTFFVAVFLTPGSRAADALPPDIEYRFQAELETSTPTLTVDLWFQGDASGTTRLRLPSHWAGQMEYYKAVHDLRVMTRGAVLLDAAEPDIREIRHKGPERLHVRYLVAQDWDGPIVNEMYYRAILRPAYFHLPGHAFLVIPDEDEEAPRRVSLMWEGFPPGWSIADSFGAGERIQRFDASLRALKHAIYVAGDFRLRKKDVDGWPVWTAARGSWEFSDEKFAELVSRVVHAERAFWKDDDIPYFLATLLPTDEPCCGHGGTSLTNSFAVFAAGQELLGAKMTHLLAHELFHAWNGGKIGKQEPAELAYWFSEGFTDYYARLLSLRAGLIALEDYVDGYNKVLKSYYESPVRAEPNSRIQKDFWNDRKVEKLPYQRGDVLAHNWNARIKRISNAASLDDVMRDILQSAVTRGVLVSTESVNAALKRYLPEGVGQDMEEFIEAGKVIPPDPRSLGPCVSMRMEEMPQFELGFDWKKSDGPGIVQGVIEGSAAYAAGLRDGQKIVGRDIYHGDVSKQVGLVVQKGAATRTLRYWPHKKPRPDEKRLLTPQFKLDEKRFQEDRASCLRWFGA
ncbi:MAG: hypothetical protein HY552_00390 [Elusimicrobia bacterium]|nr:hypothetical protein [Elusimicrobiota bacterium]